MSRISHSTLPSTLQNRFRLHSSCRFGQGSFGTILRCTELHTGKELAVKVEPNTPDSFLKYEYRIMKQLQVHQGFPSAYSYCHTETHNFLVMARLGRTVEQIWERNGREFSMATLAHISIQAVTLLERLHSLGYLHRDIKPENFMFSRDETSQELFLIDFGLSKRFGRESEGTHIKFRTGKQMIGTPRYASFAAHLGMEQGRKDDLLSLFNVIVFLLSGGRLPWMGITASTDRKKYAKIGSRKLSVPVESLADLPLPLASFVNCLLATPFEAEPPYGYLRRLLLELGSMDRLARTSFGSDLFSSEQHFLDTYKFEWTENLSTHTVLLCDPSPNNQLSVKASSDLQPQNPFSETCTPIFSPKRVDGTPIRPTILPLLPFSETDQWKRVICSPSPCDIQNQQEFDAQDPFLQIPSFPTSPHAVSPVRTWIFVQKEQDVPSLLAPPTKAQFTTPFSSPMNVSPAVTPSFPSSPVLPELLPSLQVTPRYRSRVHYVEPTPQKETPTLKTSLPELKTMKPTHILPEERLPDSDVPEPKRCELHPFRLVVPPTNSPINYQFPKKTPFGSCVKDQRLTRHNSEVKAKGLPFSSDSTQLQTSQSSPILKQPPLFVRTELGSLQRARCECHLRSGKSSSEPELKNVTFVHPPKPSPFLSFGKSGTPIQKQRTNVNFSSTSTRTQNTLSPI
ncbi:putative Casein kinase I [Blattamonas nauphoetae]|uniref:non-specific serine/threonine protein kinase n=1 Tax=Blattamonas nauphoetae TaxID=2049346 RepID=A0ABQ9YAA6_9EUKA|nr:putative Casein kinase I [Blattamonas nauphoetae]